MSPRELSRATGRVQLREHRLDAVDVRGSEVLGDPATDGGNDRVHVLGDRGGGNPVKGDGAAGDDSGPDVDLGSYPVRELDGEPGMGRPEDGADLVQAMGVEVQTVRSCLTQWREAKVSTLSAARCAICCWGLSRWTLTL